MKTSFEALEHTTRNLPQGGQVLVLDTGALIGPQAEAMIQALHSRSVGGVNEHLAKLAERGAEKFMSTYYVGYGHKSIGDCGSCTIFIEGVSMLAAKAIQDWPLYSGQESSTRYIDFSTQRFADPIGTVASAEILEQWRSFYLDGLEALIPALKQRYPRKTGESEKKYEKAIKAHAFDVMRGFLPAGATTNLAWHSNLRQVGDKLQLLRHHPLEEVRTVAETIEDAVLEAYPGSFSKKRYEKTEEYNKWWMQNKYYYTFPQYPDFMIRTDHVDREMLREYRDALLTRPEKTELPKQIDECGTLEFRFLLDFGSFRDIQRHRAVAQRMPLVVTQHGFGDWYLDQLPTALRTRAEVLFGRQEAAIARIESPETAQYYTAMGYQLPNRLVGSLRALVYLVELRATRFVHPTLRLRATQMADHLQGRFAKDGLVLHLDDEPDRFDVQRGDHDIVEKAS